MASHAASRPPAEHSRSRSASIFKPFVSSSRHPSPSKQQASSPQKSSKGQASPSKEKLSTTTPLQDIHNHESSGSLRIGLKDDTSSKQPSKIATIFSRGRSASKSTPRRDQENTCPEPAVPPPAATPIWAQFSTQGQTQQPQPQPGDVYNIPLANGSHNTSNANANGPSRVKAAVAMYNQKTTSPTKETPVIQGEELDKAFEAVLTSRNIPENMRQTMRGLDANIKRDFIKHNTTEAPPSPTKESRDEKSSSLWGRVRAKSSTRGRDRVLEDERVDGNDQETASPSKRARSRSRGRIFTLGKGDKDKDRDGFKSSSKRQRSNSRPRSLMSLKNLSTSSLNSIVGDGAKDHKDQAGAANNEPVDFVTYLKAEQKLEDVAVGKIANLRRLVRNESVAWTDEFITLGGMSALIELLQRIMKVEWREDHEDALLHELLRTLKGLATTQRALANLAVMGPSLFADLLRMLFDEERKGPSEFATREIIIWLLFQHLETALPSEKETRARALLGYLADPAKPEEEQVLDFVANMHVHRPYQVWCTEVTNVTKEVFWIFLHHMNVVALVPTDQPSETSYSAQHFPKPRPPVPAAPYVGGVEWEATNYIASHLDLINGLVASLGSAAARNRLREELRDSGFEKLMGASLRLCKEKFYGAVHDGLRTWVAAAAADGWDVEAVRTGPLPAGSPAKGVRVALKREDEPPRLQLPQFAADEPAPGRADDMWI